MAANLINWAEFLPPILGSYLCLYIWEKINTFFHSVWEDIHKIVKNKAIFGLGIPPVTGGKSGQIKSLLRYTSLIQQSLEWYF